MDDLDVSYADGEYHLTLQERDLMLLGDCLDEVLQHWNDKSFQITTGRTREDAERFANQLANAMQRARDRFVQ